MPRCGGGPAAGTEDAGNLAATGGDSTTLPLAVGGAALRRPAPGPLF
ncbi:hypothetical protein ACH46L_09385 [Streptomyces althioticus]